MNSHESEERRVRGSVEYSDWIDGEGKQVGFQEASVTSDVREFRERCKTKVTFNVTKEGCVTRIDGVDDDEHKRLDDREAQEEQFGSRKTVRKHDLCQISEQKRIEHEMTHFLSRRWCGNCIKGRGGDEDCRKTVEEERRVSEIHLDYMFMGDEKEEHRWHSVFAREKETKAVLSTVMPRKSTGEWICRRLTA